jgi:hypothetical protein
MKFEKIIGNISEDLIKQSEEILTNFIVDLGAHPNGATVFCGGGDPFGSMLLLTRNHILTEEYTTVATDGEKFYWNPNFLNLINIIDFRIYIFNLTYHINNAKQFNNSKQSKIAQEYLANNYAITELDKLCKDKLCSSGDFIFQKYIGKYITLNELSNLINANEEVKGVLADPNVTFEDIIKELSKLPEDKLNSINTDKHLEIKTTRDNDKLLSYVNGKIDLKLFENDNPQYVDPVNRVLGISSNEELSKVSKEEINDIISSFTDRYDLFHVAVLIGAKLNSFLNQDTDKSVWLNVSIFKQTLPTVFNEVQDLIETKTEDANGWIHLTDQESGTIGAKSFLSGYYIDVKKCPFVKENTPGGKINKKSFLLKKGAIFHNTNEIFKHFDLDIAYPSLRVQVGLSYLLSYKMDKIDSISNLMNSLAKKSESKKLNKKQTISNIAEIDLVNFNADIFAQNYILSEEIIDEYKDILPWEDVLTYQVLSEEFIEKHIGKVDWTTLCRYQKLSEDFVYKYLDNIKFYYLVVGQDLNKYSNKLQGLILSEVIYEVETHKNLLDHFTDYMKYNYKKLSIML